MVIEQLLGAVPLATFMEEYFLRQPFSLSGGCRHVCRLGSWSTIERLLVQPDVDVIVSRQGEQWPGAAAPPDAAQARALVGNGYTLGVRHAHRHDSGLAELANAFRHDFHAPIDVHLYCTPGGNPGFGWHYDAEEVFVLQTHGGKQWQLRKNTVNPWPLVETLPADMRHEREIMPLIRCELAAGDWLYIPSGWWHRTEASEESISLSVGVLSATGLDVFDFLRARLLQSIRGRQRLPASGAAAGMDPAAPSGDATIEECYHEVFRELGEDLAKEFRREELITAFLRHRSLQPNGKSLGDANPPNS
jgi:50S ribosomal protein L16 3-hydroxylase